MQGEMSCVLRQEPHVVCLVIVGGIHAVKQLLVPAATALLTCRRNHGWATAVEVSRDSLGLQLRSLQLEGRRDVSCFH
jgi:hypothetical protein